MAERSGVGDGGMKVGLGLETLLLLLLGGKENRLPFESRLRWE